MDYPSRVAAAKENFQSYNVKGNPTFDALKKVLDSMCSGARRCMYCEDSAADEIEHFRPKQFYPEVVFVWLNYLFTCGLCNITKRDKFAVRRQSGEIIHLVRKRKESPVVPAEGTHLLLNPRIEDPALFLTLDLVDTFAFVPSPSASQENFERAAYTIRTLGLNRDLLIRARKEAYFSYLARLKEYSAVKSTGLDQTKAADLHRQLLKMQHPTVWLEMRRWRDAIEDLATLFGKNLELLG